MDLKQGLAKLLDNIRGIESDHMKLNFEFDQDGCTSMGTTWNINPKQNYKRLGSDHVFTGQQLLNLIEVAEDDKQAIMVLIGTWPTDEPATDPNSKYGPAEK